MSKTIHYYTAGASTMRQENGKYLKGPGGWGYVQVDVIDKDRALNEVIMYDVRKEQNYIARRGGAPVTTNNEQELYAIYAALRNFSTKCKNGDTVVIYSDSAYSINIFTQWIKNWEANGWTRGKKHEPIENVTLIKMIWDLIKTFEKRFIKVDFIKVKGHSGDYWNEMVDKLAVEAKVYCNVNQCTVTYDEITSERITMF